MPELQKHQAEQTRWVLFLWCCLDCLHHPTAPVSSRSGVILHGYGSQETWDMSRQAGKTWWSTNLVVAPSFAWAPHHFWVEPMSMGTLSIHFPKGIQASRCLYGSLNPV